MRRYSYKARDSKTGKSAKGIIQAETERAAGKLLLDQGYVPDSIKETSDDSLIERLRSKVSTKDRIVFTRQFATLIGAGLPLSNALRTLAEQTERRAMRSVIEDILAMVEAGKSLYEACSQHPDVFNKVYLSLIQAGEASGTLDLALKRLADQQEKDENMMSKIRGAMTYPGIVLFVIVAVVIFMMIMVVPQVDNLYTDMGEELPVATQVLVGISNFIVTRWYVVAVALVVFGLVFSQFLKTETGIRWMALFKLNVPIFKKLFLRLYNARFARTMQMLLSTGVALLDSMRMAGEATNNVEYNKQITMAMEKVQAGKPLSVALRDKKYMLPLVPQMSSIGEESGKIDEMLGKAAKVYEDELDEQIAAISTMIEPILMVIMALLIGFIVLAVLMPIYSLVSNVG